MVPSKANPSGDQPQGPGCNRTQPGLLEAPLQGVPQRQLWPFPGCVLVTLIPKGVVWPNIGHMRKLLVLLHL